LLSPEFDREVEWVHAVAFLSRINMQMLTCGRSGV
jgi:hypothetical protein